jgi:tripartite-type tricarboxylate transporter receptor subunit TctC
MTPVQLNTAPLLGTIKPAASAGRRRRVLKAIAASTGSALLPSISSAQAAPWPSKTIRLVVGFAPGGLTDAWARLFAEQLQAKYGVSVVVENKPGAGGNIAIENVVKSPADGHHLLVTTSGAVWQNRVLYTKLPFDLEKDLTPVALYPSGPLVVAVPEKLPIKTYKEFIEYAKKNPCTMGSYAPASHPHMLADQINKKEGIAIATVHYKGEAPMWVDMAGGQLQIAVGSYQAFANVQAKGLRAIAVTGTYRSPKLPDVPTLIERGDAGELGTLFGGLPITAPAGVPQDILQKLSQVALEGWDTPKAKNLRETFAIPDRVLGLEDTRKVWREVAPSWIRIAKELGIKLD